MAKRERKRLAVFAEDSYQDTVDVTGQVLEADVRQGKFQIWLDNKRGVSVKFAKAQESQVATALKEHDEMRLRVQGRGEFDPGGQQQKIHSVKSLEVVLKEWKFNPKVPRISAVIAEICKDVPDEEWDKLPRDFSERVDFYLYGEEES